MSFLSYEQQKAYLKRVNFTNTVNGRRMKGRVIGFDEDHRGFGGVVVFPDGARAFWGINPRTMELVNLGIPPNPKRRAEARGPEVRRLTWQG